jgi:phosphoribosylanthranilate isomerase/indole-3-glycerol phosphate synthase/phosphoribosylanthranilate isomerase
MYNTVPSRSLPLVKICGLTDPDNAAACARAGADIIGLVFYSASPRNVTFSRAKSIVTALPAHVPAWGVFVNDSLKTVLDTVHTCGLKGVQLHGEESPEMIRILKTHGLTVTKAVFASRSPGLDTVEAMYSQADYLLIECGTGRLPGGNAKIWDYGLSRKWAEKHPVLIAGGLSCDNIQDALAAAAPYGVDISSGVESAPGYKDIGKVSELIRLISAAGPVHSATSCDTTDL